MIFHIFPSFVFRFLVLPGICCLSGMALAQPLMWQVEKTGEAGRVYLFGSLHFGVADFYPLPEYVSSAFDQADALMVELDVEAVPEEELLQLMTEEGFWPQQPSTDSGPLKALIGPELWQLLQRRAMEQSLDVSRFQNTRPWLVAMQLVNGQLQKSRFTSKDGIDRHFIERAREQKPILQLESFSQQIRTFSQLTDADQVAFLENTLRDYDEGPATLEALASAWRKGDAVQLEEHIFAAFRTSEIGETLYQRIFVERNHQMTLQLLDKLDTRDSYFVVTGIGHMLGEAGLVCTLQARGFDIRTFPDNKPPLCTGV